jgi:uncharacterized membrane protein YphA (DoxX/SURF4 family)
VIFFTLRVIIGMLLIVSGATKLAAGYSWRTKWLDGYGLMPSSWRPSAGLAFSSIEIIAGLLLATGVYPWLAMAALACATGVTAYALSVGRRPSCGCFGRFSRDLISWRLVCRNLVLIVGMGAVVLAQFSLRISI